MKPTAAQREVAAHAVDLLILNVVGDVVETHRMQSWDVATKAGELLGLFRDRHGYAPFARIRFVANPARDGQYLLPRDWR